jgi:TetR/AcrR family transcriptional repressor of acrEF/envCD operon
MSIESMSFNSIKGADIMQLNKRQQQKIQTRTLILETAISYFGNNGITTSRTIDIAKAANISHGTIFSHFATQEELLIAVIEEFGERITNKLHESIDTNCSLYEALETHISILIEYEAFYTRLIIERRLLPENVLNTYIAIQSAISIHISQAAEKDMESGIIRKVPIHLLFNTWMGLINYYLTNGDLFSPDGSVLEKYGKELLVHYINLMTQN